MPDNEAGEILAFALIFVVHLAGGLMLVWGMLDGDLRAGWRRRRRGDDGPGGPSGDPSPPSPPPTRTRLPLGDARPSRVRLRDETPLRDGYPRPTRRPLSPLPARSPQRR
jgi:hypothetical protein